MQAIIFARHHQETRLFLILHHKSHPLHTQRSRIPLIEFWILYSTFSTRGATDDDEEEDDGDWDVLWKVSPISLSALAYPRPSVQQPILLKLPFSCSLQKLFSPFKNFSAHLGDVARSKARLCKVLTPLFRICLHIEQGWNISCIKLDQ